jgi:hemin uptake protein HemP
LIQEKRKLALTLLITIIFLFMNKKLSEPIASAAIEPCINLSATQNPQPRLHSKELFGTAHAIVIEHAGEEYRFKLILTK